jgi:hypothetical protein
MKPLPNIVAALLVAGAASAALPAMTGCYATEGVYVVEDEPPPLRAEIVTYQPGFIWIHGRWEHPGDRWVWRDGYYVRARHNAVYVDGHWERRGRGHVWVEGGWRPHSRVVIRNHY